MLLEYDEAVSLRNGKKREIAPPRHASLRQIAREGRKHTRRCAKSPAERQTPRRVCARRRKWSLNHVCRRPVRRQNPSRLANVRSKSVRCGEPRFPQMGEPRRTLPFEYKKGAPEGAPPPQCRRGQIRTCTTRQVGRRPIASALPTSGKKPGGLQFTAGDRRPLYLMWV